MDLSKRVRRVQNSDRFVFLGPFFYIFFRSIVHVFSERSVHFINRLNTEFQLRVDDKRIMFFLSGGIFRF